MNTLEALYSRKSVRSYTGESITGEELREILKAAYAAPVGRAMYDSLMLTVISDRDFLDKWERHMAKATDNPGLHPFYGAPVVILVSSLMPSFPLNNINFSNAAILVHNMALAATELGIGACHIWGAVGVLPRNAELMAALNLPQGMAPCCAIALGRTDEKYQPREIPEGRIRTEYIG